METNNTDELLSFLAQTSEQHLRVEEDLGEGFVKLNIDEAQRRQAKHDIRCVEDIIVELLRNSRDAAAKNILVASWKTENKRKFIVIDDGAGIPSKIQNRIFEARVTSKLNKFSIDEYGVHGRGMALYSISQNARCTLVKTQKQQGTILKVSADTAQLKETADQSTNPKIKKNKHSLEVLGPNNIVKTILLFNLKYPELNIYLGSPAEITAKLFDFSSRSFSSKDPFTDSHEKYIFCLSYVKNAGQLAETVRNHYGLEVSSRNSHRILTGDIASPKPLIERFKVITKISKKKVNRSLAGYFTGNDLQQLQNGVANIFNNVGSKYFIKLGEQPLVKRDGNKMKIILHLEKVEEI